MTEQEEIKAICEKHGYGSVMSIASHLWADNMVSLYGSALGVFVPVIATDINKKRASIYKKEYAKAFGDNKL